MVSMRVCVCMCDQVAANVFHEGQGHMQGGEEPGQEPEATAGAKTGGGVGSSTNSHNILFYQ